MFKKSVGKALAFVVMFMLSTTAFADYGFKVDSIDGGKVKLSWDRDTSSSFYIVYYGDTSSSDLTYASETDLLDSTSHTIGDLTGNTKYYFKLKGVNADGITTFTSEEISADIPEGSQSSGFSLQKAEQSDIKSLKLYFSHDLSTTQDKAERVFTIEGVNQPNLLEVVDSKISEEDSKVLLLTLDAEPVKDQEYKVVVVDLLDAKGNNIEYGVDSETRFIGGNIIKDETNVTSTNNTVDTPEDTPIVEENTNEDNENIANEEEKTETVEEENLNSAGPSETTKSGRDMKDEEIAKDVKGEARENDKLPKTGPEIMIVLFIALMLSAIFFVPKYIKQ